MNGQQIRQALHAGDRVYGTLASAPATLWVNMNKGNGLDFVFIDTEHIPNDRQTLSWMCQAYQAIDLPPIVRVPNPAPYEACKVLDGGASGVIFPYVEEVSQIRDLVGACRYRPLKGARLQQALDDPQSLEPELAAYLAERNAHSIAVANIESMPAIENLDALLAVEGLDAVLLGPHDLSCRLGIQRRGHPLFLWRHSSGNRFPASRCQSRRTRCRRAYIQTRPQRRYHHPAQSHGRRAPDRKRRRDYIRTI